jgi:lysophospholipase L1-like esterase
MKPAYFLWMCALLPAGAADRPSFRFDFGAKLLESATYTAARGYGFDLDSKVTCHDHSCTSAAPFFFSVKLPEGNYDVTVTLGDSTAAGMTTVKAESRRLMLERISTAPGQFVSRTFTVNIRTPRIGSGGEVKLKPREVGILDWDDKLTLEFNDTHPAVSALEITPSATAITVYLLGDSTVTDQTAEPWNSWGQMLPRFFKAGVAVANHAASGESLKSSLNSRRLDKVADTLRVGDYLFIQYGHNDMKQQDEGVGPFTTYKADLERFVAAARAHGAIPVLLTPMHRRTFDEAGKVTNSHGDYPDAVRRVAAEQKAPLIDLNAMSKPFYEALGPEDSKKAFVDNTHHNNYGSYELAKCVVEGIKANSFDLAKQLTGGVPPFDPAHPDSIAEFKIPASPQNSAVKPEGN